jgi:hypothetical protein
MTAPTADFWRAEYARENQLRADCFGAFMDSIVRGTDQTDRLGDDLLASSAVAHYVLQQLVSAVRAERATAKEWQLPDGPSIPRRSVS